MADNDSIIIKPVESLKNIAGLTPAGRRENRKRRQQLKRENEQDSEAEGQLNEIIDEQQSPIDMAGDKKEQSDLIFSQRTDERMK